MTNGEWFLFSFIITDAWFKPDRLHPKGKFYYASIRCYQ